MSTLSTHFIHFKFLQDAELIAAVDKKNTAVTSANRHVAKIRGLIEEAKARTAELKECRAELARVQEELQVCVWGGGGTVGWELQTGEEIRVRRDESERAGRGLSGVGIRGHLYV